MISFTQKLFLYRFFIFQDRESTDTVIHVSELQQLVGDERPATCRQSPELNNGEVSFCESDIDGAEHRLRIDEKVRLENLNSACFCYASNLFLYKESFEKSFKEQI
jgi:hypothetical protein